nr:MFS transporter [Paraglaciecola mesophila]
MSIINKDSRYYLAGFLNACVMASLMPVLSLYAYRYLDATATELSALLGGYALSSIVYAFVIARIVERFGKHKVGLLAISFIAFVALLVLANTKNYALACFVILTLFAPFHASTSLLMGEAFRYFSGVKVHQVNARLMATVSAAWVVCPGIAFYLVEYIGFSLFFYLLSALLPLLAGVFFILPTGNTSAVSAMPHKYDVVEKRDMANAANDVNRIFQHEGKWHWRLFVPALFFAVVSFAITLYQHLLPVYFVKQSLPVSLVGTIFMVAALLEVALIVRCVNLLSRFSYHQLFMAASACGIAFFILLPFSQSMFYLFTLQALKAILYSFMAGLGVNLLQGLFPSRPTFGAVLYQNAFAFGMLLAGFVSGAVVEYFPVAQLFSFSALLMLVAVLVLVLGKRAFHVASQSKAHGSFKG